MSKSLADALREFQAAHRFKGKGPLSVALVVTRRAKDGLPLNPEKLVTDRGGQVVGLNKAAVQSILKKYGIEQVLASEAGRTSRGSMANMRKYVAFLNDLHDKQLADLEAIELFWVERVSDFFAAKPFRIKLDASRSLRAVVGDVLQQAQERQKAATGTHYAGAVLQHIVGAKLDCALTKGSFTHNSFSTADAPGGRAGDFFIGDSAIHVTTSPSEALIERCIDNLNDGHKPIIVTTKRGLPLAEGLAQNKGIADRLDVFEAEQFVALNLYELGRFKAEGRRVAVRDLVSRYNEIIDAYETDPSLKIELK